MLNLARNGYTADAVRAALHASAKRLEFRYELYNRHGEFKRVLTEVTRGVVEFNALSEIKRIARFEMRDSADVDYLNDRIKPIVLLRMPDNGYAEFPLGVFLLATSPRTVTTSAVTRTIEAYDSTLILTDDKVSERFTSPAGANYIAEVKRVLDSAGITLQNLTSTSKTLPTVRDWEPGTTKLRIINDLLAAINYTPLWFDENGFAVAASYVLPSDKASEYTYADDGKSVMFVDIEQGIDLWNVPNKWVLVVSESDRPVLRAEYTNSNPDSLTSTISRGRTIVDVREVEADSQASLDAMVRRVAFEASQVYETLQMSTAIMPMHSHADVITVKRSDLGITAKYAEVHWGFELKVGASMKHVLRRVVNV